MESINKRYARVEKVTRTQKIKDSVAEFHVLQKLSQFWKMVYQLVPLNLMRKNKRLSKLFLLTTKPVLYVANVGEDEVADPDNIDYVQQIREFAATENAEVVVISAC